MAASIQSNLGQAVAVFAHQIRDFGGEGARGLVIAPGNRRPNQLGMPGFVDRFQTGADMGGLRILEKNDRSFPGDQEIASRVAQKVTEHVARPGRVALIVGIEQDEGGIVLLPHHAADAFQTPAPQGDGIDLRRLGIGQPKSGAAVAPQHHRAFNMRGLPAISGNARDSGVIGHAFSRLAAIPRREILAQARFGNFTRKNVFLTVSVSCVTEMRRAPVLVDDRRRRGRRAKTVPDWRNRRPPQPR